MPPAQARSAPVKSRNGPATRRTVIVAGAANLLVGLAKLAAGIMSGSSAVLAESAHSAADTLDQVFLLMSLRQANRPASRDHPFGHGQERYFWSLLAAFGIFVAGGGFSVFEGVLALTRSQHENPLIAYAALAVAFAAEGASFARAFWQVRGEARQRHEEVLEHVESSPDITVKVVLFEDSAAVVGLIIATVGVGLRQLTGSPVWDGGASIANEMLVANAALPGGSPRAAASPRAWAQTGPVLRPRRAGARATKYVLNAGISPVRQRYCVRSWALTQPGSDTLFRPIAPGRRGRVTAPRAPSLAAAGAGD